MKEVTLQPLNQKVEIQTNFSILDTLLSQECPVNMACGGNGLCATCHVYIEEGMESLTAMTKREERTLSMLTGVTSQSRLSCQCRIIGEGVQVRLPDGLFVQSFNELEALIGRRTNVPILHPIDGRILINNGKIISRSKIMELKDTDFDTKDIDTLQA